jgi:hypothetical protein
MHSDTIVWIVSHWGLCALPLNVIRDPIPYTLRANTPLLYILHIVIYIPHTTHHTPHTTNRPPTHLGLYLYTFIPLYLYTIIPLYLYTFIPIYLYTYIPIGRGKGISASDFCWVQRLDPYSGQDISWNKLTGEVRRGVERAQLSSFQRGVIKVCVYAYAYVYVGMWVCGYVGMCMRVCW